MRWHQLRRMQSYAAGLETGEKKYTLRCVCFALLCLSSLFMYTTAQQMSNQAGEAQPHNSGLSGMALARLKVVEVGFDRVAGISIEWKESLGFHIE